jgi:hypothetical protein
LFNNSLKQLLVTNRLFLDNCGLAFTRDICEW